MKKLIMLTALLCSVFGGIAMGMGNGGTVPIPTGSYVDTCRNCKLSCDGTLTCDCQRIGKDYGQAATNINRCNKKDSHDRVDVWNNNGNLECAQ